MHYGNKTKKELIRELSELYSRVEDLRRSEAECERMEAQVRQQTEFLKLVLDSIPHPFYVIDVHDYTVKIANSATYGGCSATKGTTCHALTHRSDKPCGSDTHPCPLEIVKETKRPVMLEHVHYDRGGNPIDVEVHGYPILDAEGNVTQIIESCIDITERKRAERELRESREQLRDLYAHLQGAREQERAIIAREIHDDLGQTLTALKIDLHWLARNLSKDREVLLKKTESIMRLVDMTFQSVKRIYSGLRPFLLDDLGLGAAVEWMTQRFQEKTGIQCELNLTGQEIVLHKDVSTALFRILQETLTNVSRHADATKVGVNLEQEAGMVTLTVSDNGKGITEEQISDPKSFGLMGIQERTQMMGGEVRITGIANKGTTVEVSIPRVLAQYGGLV